MSNKAFFYYGGFDSESDDFLFKIAFLYLGRDPRPTWRVTNTRAAPMNDNRRDVFIKTARFLFLFERNCAHKNGVGMMTAIFHCRQMRFYEAIVWE